MSLSLYIAAIAAIDTKGTRKLEFSPLMVMANDMTRAVEKCKTEAYKRWPPEAGWQLHQAAIDPAPKDVMQSFRIAFAAGSFIDSKEQSTLTIF